MCLLLWATNFTADKYSTRGKKSLLSVAEGVGIKSACDEKLKGRTAGTPHETTSPNSKSSAAGTGRESLESRIAASLTTLRNQNEQSLVKECVLSYARTKTSKDQREKVGLKKALLWAKQLSVSGGCLGGKWHWQFASARFRA